MTKVALLVGVSEYQSGFSFLPKAQRDVEEMQRVLQNPEMDGFNRIKPLINPDPQTLRVEIESLFAGRSKEDLVLLYFSGHGIKDDRGNLYLATRDTRKTISGELIRATAIEASFVQSLMGTSRCKRQVVILDCCFSGAFAAGMEAKDSGMIDIEAQLGGEGRAVLTSSTSTQYSFEEETSDLSIYTRYLVEGLETGAADSDRDGWIEVEELHDYAKGKVQATAPAMKPEIYAIKEGFKIRLTRAQIGDPTLRYRQEAERYASRGEIGGVGRFILDTLQEQLGLSAEDAAQIEDELLRPYREQLENLQRYRQAVLTAVEVGYPFGEQTRSDLNHFKDILGLRDEDVAPIEAEATAVEEQTRENRAHRLAQYRQALSRAIEEGFPLSQETQHQLQQLQHFLKLTDADIVPIEESLLPQKKMGQPPGRLEEPVPSSPTPSTEVPPQYRVETPAPKESIPSPSKPGQARKVPATEGFWFRWVWASSIGFAIGSGVIIVLSPMLLTLIISSVVVGLLQSMVLRKQIPSSHWGRLWVYALSLPWGVAVGSAVFSFMLSAVGYSSGVAIISIAFGVVIGTYVVALMQKWVFKKQISSSNRGWFRIYVLSLPVAIAAGVFVGSFVASSSGAWLVPLEAVAWLVGGTVYGGITGGALAKFLERSAGNGAR